MRKNQEQKQRKVIITAGPTIEKIDPVRYISNYSSGTMGYLIAGYMRDKGFNVVMVSGPVIMDPPEGIKVISVRTADEMNSAVKKQIKGSCCIIASAAVSDFKVKRPSKRKIKKKEGMTLRLVKNADILAELKEQKDLVKVGFALETENALKNAQKKLREKDLDLIVVNRLSGSEDPFGKNTAGTGKTIKRNYDILYKSGERKRLTGISKKNMAFRIACETGKFLKKR